MVQKLEKNFMKWVKRFLPNVWDGENKSGSWNYRQKNRQNDIFSQLTENGAQKAFESNKK